MTIEECIKLIDEYYPVPVQKTWKPDEYLVKCATTPARRRRLEKTTEKENAKLKAEYDKFVNVRKSCVAAVNRLAAYPAEIACLFANTFGWTISDLKRRHERYLALAEELKTKWGDEVFSRLYELRYLVYDYSGRRMRPLDQAKWDDWKKRNYAFKDVTDYADLVRDYSDWASAKDNDKVATNGASAYSDAIRHCADVVDEVCDELDRIFGGKPEGCETDPNWGVGGKFNGIIFGNGRRVSFCSFSAGGHNIQRYHFRYKITELKSK